MHLNGILTLLDTLLSFQYYYFVRLMGGKASHVALECALQSHPNMVWFDQVKLFHIKLDLYIFTSKFLHSGYIRRGGGVFKAHIEGNYKQDMRRSRSKGGTRSVHLQDNLLHQNIL